MDLNLPIMGASDTPIYKQVFDGIAAQILCGNLERMGIENALITSMEPEALCSSTGPVFDRVLVDAPCAGEGMFRKDPQAAAEWSPEHVRSCARRQRSILMSAQKTLKPGGMLVYSTCSFSPEENEETVEWFLSACPDFTLEQCRTLYPHNSLGEGQFAALLRRQGPLLPTLWRHMQVSKCFFQRQFRAMAKGPLRRQSQRVGGDKTAPLDLTQQQSRTKDAHSCQSKRQRRQSWESVI